MNDDGYGCICDHDLMLHDASGRCHGLVGVVSMPCSCWCFRRPGQAVVVQRVASEPDWARVVRLLESIEYHTRTRR